MSDSFTIALAKLSDALLRQAFGLPHRPINLRGIKADLEGVWYYTVCGDVESDECYVCVEYRWVVVHPSKLQELLLAAREGERRLKPLEEMDVSWDKESSWWSDCWLERG